MFLFCRKMIQFWLNKIKQKENEVKVEENEESWHFEEVKPKLKKLNSIHEDVMSPIHAISSPPIRDVNYNSFQQILTIHVLHFQLIEVSYFQQKLEIHVLPSQPMVACHMSFPP